MLKDQLHVLNSMETFIIYRISRANNNFKYLLFINTVIFLSKDLFKLFVRIWCINAQIDV